MNQMNFKYGYRCLLVCNHKSSKLDCLSFVSSTCDLSQIIKFSKKEWILKLPSACPDHPETLKLGTPKITMEGNGALFKNPQVVEAIEKGWKEWKNLHPGTQPKIDFPFLTKDTALVLFHIKENPGNWNKSDLADLEMSYKALMLEEAKNDPKFAELVLEAIENPQKKD